MWKLRGIIIVSLLLISSLVLPIEFDEPNFESNLHKTQIIDSEIALTSEELDNETGTRGLGDHRQNKPHGGSWLDSFEDDSELDPAFCNNVSVINGNVKIERGISYNEFSDSFSGPLDLNEWKNVTGGGMTLYTYPYLRAV
jgi:hypothetical protein